MVETIGFIGLGLMGQAQLRPESMAGEGHSYFKMSLAITMARSLYWSMFSLFRL